MKKLRTLLTLMAFSLASLAAYAFSKPAISDGMIDVKGKGSNCPSGQVPDTCLSTAEDQICTFKLNETTYEAVSSNVTKCSDASVLRRPN